MLRKEFEENNQVKRNTALPNSGEDEKKTEENERKTEENEKKSESGFKFPSRSARLTKRSADHQPSPAEDIQPVGRILKQPPEF